MVGPGRRHRHLLLDGDRDELERVRRDARDAEPHPEPGGWLPRLLRRHHPVDVRVGVEAVGEGGGEHRPREDVDGDPRDHRDEEHCEPNPEEGDDHDRRVERRQDVVEGRAEPHDHLHRDHLQREVEQPPPHQLGEDRAEVPLLHECELLVRGGGEEAAALGTLGARAPPRQLVQEGEGQVEDHDGERDDEQQQPLRVVHHRPLHLRKHRDVLRRFGDRLPAERRPHDHARADHEEHHQHHHHTAEVEVGARHRECDVEAGEGADQAAAEELEPLRPRLAARGDAVQHVGDHREKQLAEDEEEREAPPDERGVAARLARLAAQAALLILRPPRTRVRPEALRVPAVAHQPVAPVVVDSAAPRVEAVVHRDRLVPTHAAGPRPGAHEARRRRRHDEDPGDKRERDEGARQEERTAHGLQEPGRRHLRQQRLAHEEEDERHALREERGMGG